MKKIFTLLMAAGIASVMNAAVFTVSNNTANPGQYNNFAAAHTAAANGDSIYVHGSNINYGTFNITKRITVIGTGHNPQKQAPLKSFVDYINMGAGSSRSNIIGLEVYQLITANDGIDSLLIQNCKFTNRIYILHSYSDVWTIDGNVFASTGENLKGGCNMGGHQVRNNIFNGQIVDFGNCAQGYSYCDHNVFLRNTDMMYNVFNWYFTNNIFYRGNPHGYAEANNTWNYNISYQCANNNFPNGVGNQVNVNPGFVNFPVAGDYFSYAYDFHITDGQPADNAGNDATDLGVYGGTGDYNQNGIPRIPYMYEFNITNPVVSSGGNLNVNFKSRIR
ncbi:MAG: hypothetical protein ACKVOR_13750 [Flavobacteriales bacterium]